MTAAGRSLADYEGRTSVQLDGEERALPTYGERAARSIAHRLYVDGGQDAPGFRLVFESAHASLLVYRAWADAEEGAAFAREAYPIDSQEDAVQLARLAERPTLTERGAFYGGRILPTVRVFERVEGALLEGVAAPGREVIAAVDLHAQASGRTWTEERTSVADESGRFAIRFPYSTRSGAASTSSAASTASGEATKATAPDVVATSRVRIVRADPQGSARTTTVEVTDDDVRSGRSVRVPN